jgi:NitT/TauT family transport system substrate-binding protein
MPSVHIIAVSAWLWIAGLVYLTTAPARAADSIRVAVQKTGTLAGEIDVVRTHGLDTAAGITITSLELASPEAGKIALRSGTVDVIVADWLWVSRERSLGANLVFYPYEEHLIKAEQQYGPQETSRRYLLPHVQRHEQRR